MPPPRPSVRPPSTITTRTTSASPRPAQHAEIFSEYAQRIAEAPEVGCVRGMFFAEIVRLVPTVSTSVRARYLPFSMYPLREFMQLLVEGARTMAPSKNPEDALRELGQSAYATFASSMVGISLLSGAGDDATSVLTLLPRAYAMLFDPGTAEIVSHGKHEALVKLRDVWSFPESYNVGVWLGALDVLDVDGTVDVIRHSWCNVDLHVRWSVRK